MTAFLFIIIVRCREFSTTIFFFWDERVKPYNRIPILIKVLLAVCTRRMIPKKIIVSRTVDHHGC